MPTLHHRVRKSERASTKAVAIKKARALTIRKSPTKKASRYVRATVSTELNRVREDALDLRLIREAREADKGKARYTVKELRAQRGLPAI